MNEVLTRIGFTEIEKLLWNTIVPIYSAIAPETKQKVLVKIGDRSTAEALAGDNRQAVDYFVQFLRGSVRWEAKCRELLGADIALSYIRDGVVEDEPDLIFAHQNATPLSEYIGKPEIVDRAPEIGMRMCELCLAGQRKKLSVAQYILCNWLICDDGRLSLPDFTGTNIRDKSVADELMKHPDCQAYRKMLGDKVAEASVANDRRQTLESFAFMMLTPDTLDAGKSFQQLSIELAISQHAANDATRAGIEFTNPVAESYFAKAPPSFLVYLVLDIFSKKIKGPSILMKKLRRDANDFEALGKLSSTET